jgi:hypothetical protein
MTPSWSDDSCRDGRHSRKRSASRIGMDEYVTEMPATSAGMPMHDTDARDERFSASAPRTNAKVFVGSARLGS